MKKLSLFLCAIAALSLSANLFAVGPNYPPDGSLAGQLDSQETADLLFSREEEKLARDTYISLHDIWQDKIFLNISTSEQRHMDSMLKMINLYGLEDPIVDDTIGAFANPDLDALYLDLVDRGGDSLAAALNVGAYVEELDIRDLRIAIANTDEEPLLGSYTNLLAGARNHLRAFVARIIAIEGGYTAQVLSPEDVEEIVGDYTIVPPEGFTINAGLNDAWYYPGTDGQGFVITVFPGQKTVFLVWFTYDTELPGEDDTANLGDPGQRWLVAQGNYIGAEADLEVASMSGGLFDIGEPAPGRTPIGSILLQFENCSSGSVFYDIPSIDRTGIVPIQRVNSENVALCNAKQGGD